MKQEIENIIKVKKVAEFGCAYQENAINITIALAQAGRFVKIRKFNSEYIVEIYEYKK